MKLQQLFENQKMGVKFIVDYVVKLHKNSYDIEEGDLIPRINQYETYTLKTIAIAILDLDEFDIDDDKVDEYAVMDIKTSPPIVYDPVNKSIIDGTHRANALAKSGATVIQAYVGDKNTYSPVEIGDDE